MGGLDIGLYWVYFFVKGGKTGLAGWTFPQPVFKEIRD